jgi:hypothetical protein
MAFDPVSAVFSVGEKLIDRLWPDPAERAKAKLDLMKLQDAGELKELETRMSAIIAEAKSDDPWTSRARPSFLYVMYVLILFSIPMGILSVFRPDMSTQIAEGMKAWLAAIPGDLYYVFGLGYSGYTLARSAWDKKRVK